MIQQRYWQKNAEQVRGLHMAPRVQGTRISFTSWRKSLEVDSGCGLHNSLYASRWDLEFFSTISVIIFSVACIYIYLLHCIMHHHYEIPSALLQRLQYYMYYMGVIIMWYITWLIFVVFHMHVYMHMYAYLHTCISHCCSEHYTLFKLKRGLTLLKQTLLCLFYKSENWQSETLSKITELWFFWQPMMTESMLLWSKTLIIDID